MAAARFEVLESRAGAAPLAAMFPAWAEGETNAEGRLPMDLPRREGLLVLIDSPGYLPWTAAGDASLAVLERGRTWKGRVVSSSRREIRSGRACATWKEDFKAWGETRIWQRCGEIQPGGEVTLTGLPAGTVTAEVRAPGFLILRRTTALPPGETFRLKPGILVSGRTVGPGPETPLGHAAVRSEGGSPVESREDGSFAIAVPSLPAILEASAPGFRPQRATAGKDRRKGELVVRLERGEQIRGTLMDEDHKPIQRAVLWIERQAAGRFRSENREVAAPESLFLLDLPEPGAYRLRFQAEGFRDEPLPEISVARGESLSLGTITLRRGSGVEGTVKDAASGAPLSGVEAELLPEGTSLLDAVAHRRIPRAVTAGNGRFRISGVATGRFRLALRRAGYATSVETVSLSGDRPLDLGEIALGKGTLLLGNVLDREGNPQRGLAVRILDRERSGLLPLAERATDAEGRFEGPRLAAGPYRLQLRGSRLLLEQEIEIPEGRDEWPLDLVAGGVHVTGTVTRRGEPVAGGTLSLSADLDPARRRGKIVLSMPGSSGLGGAGEEPFTYGFPETRLSTTVRSDGTFELNDVPDGALTAAYSGDSGSFTRSVSVPDAVRASLSIEIGGAVLQGRAVAAGGETGVEALIRVVEAGTGGQVASQPADAAGEFAIPDLPPGLYTVQASAEGFETRTLKGVEVKEGAVPLRISLESGGDGGLRLRLRYPDGTPAAWVPVTLLDASGDLVQSLPTQGDGGQELEGLPGGTYWLAWSDPLAGAGASEPFQIVPGEVRSLEKTLPEGGPLEVSCDPERCAGRRIEALSLVAASGAEIGPQLSGASPALRFSASGRASLGRLSPGTYRLRLWTRGETWERTFNADSAGAQVSLP